MINFPRKILEIKNIIMTDDTRLRWRGAIFASQYVFVGCVFFFFVLDIQIGFALFLIIMAFLFSLPFSVVGGYILGCLLQKKQWNKHNYAKAIVSGVGIASISIIVIFIVGGGIQGCLTSHGQCSEDGYLKQLVIYELESGFSSTATRVFMARFLSALPVAAIGGGVTAWRLVRKIH